MKSYKDHFYHIIINSDCLILMNHQLVNWISILSLTPVALSPFWCLSLLVLYCYCSGLNDAKLLS